MSPLLSQHWILHRRVSVCMFLTGGDVAVGCIASGQWPGKVWIKYAAELPLVTGKVYYQLVNPSCMHSSPAAPAAILWVRPFNLWNRSTSPFSTNDTLQPYRTTRRQGCIAKVAVLLRLAPPPLFGCDLGLSASPPPPADGISCSAVQEGVRDSTPFPPGEVHYERSTTRTK